MHPEVNADAGAAELVELTDEEVETELRAAGVDVAGKQAPGGEGPEARSVEESGAWTAYSEPPAVSPAAPTDPAKAPPASPQATPAPEVWKTGERGDPLA